ncbi:MAG TPA: hypothetical protein VFL76_11450 [Edaphocola sp.]|nr:hypothetical protein [Edaphocola sp.]
MKWPLIFLLPLYPAILFGQEDTAMNARQANSGTDNVFSSGVQACLLPEITINNNQFPNIMDAKGPGTSFRRMLSQMNGHSFPLRGLSPGKRAIVVNGLTWMEPGNQDIDFNGLAMFYKNAQISTGNGLSAGSTTNGGLDGWSSFSINPLKDQRRLQAGYTFSNGDYKHAVTVIYHSGKQKGSWAIDFSLANKWAQEGYIQGTSFQTQGYLLSVSKDISSNHHLTLTAVGNSEKRASSSPVTKEVKILSGTAYYNPYWGFQSGEKRNPNTLKSFIPALILDYEGQLSPTTEIKGALSYQNGYENFGGLDWYQARNPHADYYKNMPSYYYLQGGALNQSIGNDLRQEWQNNPKQLDWSYFYAANRMNAQSITGGSLNSLYVLSEDRHRMNRWLAALSFSKKIREQLHIYTGLQLVNDRSAYFQELKDLLGGTYFVNLNQFADRSGNRQNGQPQFDLKNPNRKIGPGDKYHYYYLGQVRKAKFWSNGLLREGNFDFWAAGSLDVTAYQRTGYYQNGVFPEESFGASGWKKFMTVRAKIGIRFKVNPYHQLSASVMAGSNAPGFDNTFFAPKIRNTVIGNLQPEQFRAVDIDWRLNYGRWHSHLQIFRSELTRQTDVLAFYHDDYQSFVHMVIQGISSRQTGIEYTLSVNPRHWFSFDVVGGWVQSFYTSRPKVSVFRDNDTISISKQETVYWKNYIAVCGPQTLIGLRLNIHDQHWGFLSVSGTWQNRSFVALNPVRHSEDAVYFTSNNKKLLQNIIAQEELPAFYLVNLRAGRTFHFGKSRKKYLKYGQIGLSAGINNVLNNRDYALYGSEQLRFDMESRDPAYFPNKYTYGYGRTYFISVQYTW